MSFEGICHLPRRTTVHNSRNESYFNPLAYDYLPTTDSAVVTFLPKIILNDMTLH
jgi:hypothetical protein